MATRGLTRRCCAAMVLTAVAACSPGSTKPTPTPAADRCDVSALADWQERGLAVLLIQEDNVDKVSLGGMDVRNGDIKARCNLPRFAEPYHTLPMKRNGVSYNNELFNQNSVLWRTQWISPNFRWIISGDKDVVNLGTGHRQKVIDSGQVTAVGDDVALAHIGADWCMAHLDGNEFRQCAPLDDPAEDGSFVLDSKGRPIWISADERPLRFPGGVGAALTDGERVLRAEFTPPDKVQPGPQVDPSGRALFSEVRYNNPPPGYQVYDWFTIDRVEENQILLRPRRSSVTPDTFYDFSMTVGQSRAIISNGSAAVFGDVGGGLKAGSRFTRFFMLVEGKSNIYDLSGDRGLTCPGDPCQILAWPDISLDLATRSE